MNKRYERFLQRATEMHGNKFHYSESNFVNYKTKMKIICPVHGEFEQVPDKHVVKNSKGCPFCWSDIHKIILQNIDRSAQKKKDVTSKEEFLLRANEKFLNKFSYDLSNFNGISKNEIKITCPLHGDFYKKPHIHLSASTGCYHCGLDQKNSTKTKEYEYVVDQLNKKHLYKYDYPEYNKEIYKNKKTVIDIICKEHGLFKKKTQKHLVGQGCFQCKINELIQNNILVGGYSETLFEDKPELKYSPAKLYYLEINNGELYKIGISRVKIDNRIRNIISKAKGEIKDLKILKEENDTLYNCFVKEQKILNDFYSFRIFKSWSTELFSKNVLCKNL
jgi:hypothetical protein